MMGKPSRDRKKALGRSLRALDAALRCFRAAPSSRVRAAVDRALDATELAYRLPCVLSDGDRWALRQWEDAWLAAHLALYRVAGRGGL